MARSTGRRADYIWNGVSSSLTVTSGSSGIQDVSGAFGQSGTIVRIRGNILASLDSPTINEKTAVAMGIIRTTEEQLAVGITAIPNPQADLDADWQWHGFLPLQAVVDVTSGAGSQENVGRLVIDSKAMRKVRQGENLTFVVDNTAISGTPEIDVTFGIRILFAS